jgi:hypothetical protein
LKSLKALTGGHSGQSFILQVSFHDPCHRREAIFFGYFRLAGAVAGRSFADYSTVNPEYSASSITVRLGIPVSLGKMSQME